MTQTKDPTAASRQARRRARLEEQGLKQVPVFVPADRADEIREIARKMREKPK